MLINCVAYQEGNKLADIHPGEISDYVNRPECFVWVALFEPSAALVAVPTMIAGVYGMNFDLMPELKWAFGYPLAIGLMVAIDAYLFYRFRKAKWL